MTLKDFLYSDLIRYAGTTGLKSFVQYYFSNYGFRFTVWLRICSSLRKSSVGKYTLFPFSLIALALAWASILTIDFVGRKVGFTGYYFFVADSHKILALLCSFAFFMLFKNIQMKPNRFINTVAASTFGVLMIHANSYTMIRFLWQDVLHNTSFYNSPWLIVHAVCSVIGVYVICVAMDYLRIKFLEKPLFDYLDKKKILQ
ncbi:MAG: hypothetical protein RSF73_10845 [Ruthenibacterium sp.]